MAPNSAVYDIAGSQLRKFVWDSLVTASTFGPSEPLTYALWVGHHLVLK